MDLSFRPSAVIALFGFLLMTPVLSADVDADLIEKQQRQREIKEETDRIVRQMETTLRVMQFYRLGKDEEQKMLEEAARTLSRLSKEQMTEVIDRLEKAAKATTKEQADTEKAAAYKVHRELIAGLRELIQKRATIQSLEDAAARFDDLAKKQRDLYLTAGPLIQVILDPDAIKQNATDMRGRFQARSTDRSARRVLTLLSDHQNDLWTDVRALLDKQLPALRPVLTVDQQDRLTHVLDLARALDIAGTFQRVKGNLEGASWFAFVRNPKYKEALELQWKIAGDLQQMADALRASRDKLDMLRSAKARLDEVMAMQRSTQGQTEKIKEKSPNSPLMLQQGRLAQEAQALHQLMESSLEPKIAAPLAEGVTKMRAAEKALQRVSPKEAAELQKQAQAALDQASKQLEQAIASEEKLRNDPLAALEDSIQSIDKLIKKQNEAQKQAGAVKSPDELQKLALPQRDLMRQARQIARKPLPGQNKALSEFQQVEKAMQDAAKVLGEQKGPAAQKLQSQAMDHLSQAKKIYEEKAAEIEKRRKDIAALEMSKKELDKLISQENQVAETARAMKDSKELKQLEQLSKQLEELAKQGKLTPEAEKLAKELAKELAKNPGELTPEMERLASQLTERLSEELAKKQGELMPEAEKLAKELAKELSPEAAKRLAESMKDMQSARQNLEKQASKLATKDADRAAKRMQDAMKDLAKVLDEKKLKEMMEQAVLNPDEISPSKAAQQVAKALEQVEDAQKLSKEATEQLAERLRQLQKSGKLEENLQQRAQLAQLQKQLARQAEELELDDARLLAEEAARALQRGDFQRALRQQSDTIEELQHAAKSRRQGEPTPEQLQQAMDLAKAQQELFQSTKSFSKSQEATAAALAALIQAQSQSPQLVRDQLEQAFQELARARDRLGEGSSRAATESQREAARQLMQALEDLNLASEAMDQQRAQPGQSPRAVARSKGPEKGEPDPRQPDRRPANNLDPGREIRVPDRRINHSPSELLNAQGKGGFIHLPARQRDMVRQALGQKLPPEYAAMIQQYYLNIAKSKARSTPRR